MPTNKHYCCDDAQAIIYKYKCSNNRSHIVNGSFISPLLDECKNTKYATVYGAILIIIEKIITLLNY